MRASRITGMAALLVLAAGSAAAQADPATIPVYSGQDFAGIDLPAPARANDASFAARRGHAWEVENVQRLLLERDVEARIGLTTFYADRLSVWIEPITLNVLDDDENVQQVRGHQIAMYFDNLRSPASAPGALAQEADRLLVTAVLVDAQIDLSTDLLLRGRPEVNRDFLLESEDRLAGLLLEITNQPLPKEEPVLAAIPVPARIDPSQFAPKPIDQLFPDPREQVQPAAERVAVRLPREGTVSAFAPEIESFAMENGSDAAVMMGGVSIQYQPTGEDRPVELTATRAVVLFAEGASSESVSTVSEDIEGIYLEGAVIVTNGDYTLRGERLYYRPDSNEALALDAVFWTYDEKRGLPIYMRAEAIRQLSLDQWHAGDVTMSNVGFAKPHFSIGASEVTVSRVERVAGNPDAGERVLVDAEGVGFRVGDSTVMGVPRVRGELQQSVIREFAWGSRSGANVISTVLDVYPLLGLEAPENGSLELTIDGYLERGMGFGLDSSWDSGDFLGQLSGYFIYDHGTDQFGSGEEIERDDIPRGLITAENVWFADENWTLFTEAAYVSDEAFVEAFFPNDAETRRAYDSSIYLRHLDNDAMFTAEARGHFNDFIVAEYLLQSQGYSTEKLPEITYQIVGRDFYELANYTGHIQLSRQSLRFDEFTPRDRGIFNVGDSIEAFGIAPTVSFAERLAGAGLTEEEVTRLDTRHEIEVPLRAGNFNVVPFASGRLTLWDEDIRSLGSTVDKDTRHRLFGTVGVRLNTSIVKVNDGVQSDLFDLNRIRHIIEPSVTIWASGSNVEQDELVVYDDEVESLATGTTFRIGARNTWQTYRGDANSQYSVDWLTLDTHFVFGSSEIEPESPFHSFDEARPEHSTLDDYFDLDAVLRITDATTLIASLDWNIDENEASRTIIGARIDHGEGFSTFFEWRDLDAISARRLIAGAHYELTRKYAATLAGSYSIEENQFDNISARLVRRFPQWTIEFGIAVDNVADDISAGVSFRPVGTGGEDRHRAFTESNDIFLSAPGLRELSDGRYNSGPLRAR